jgi:hypothetical protein
MLLPLYSRAEQRDKSAWNTLMSGESFDRRAVVFKSETVLGALFLLRLAAEVHNALIQNGAFIHHNSVKSR